MSKSIFFVIAIFLTFLFTGCLKSNCTDQVKNPELYGIWYYYNVFKFEDYCDSLNNKGQQVFYSCDKIFLERVRIQFSSDRFIVEEYRDTTINAIVNYLIDPDFSKYNIYMFYTSGHYLHLDIDRDWFVDKTSLIICPNNSLCFENECDVYTWKVDNGNLFLQNNSTTYLLTREDLFEKLRDTTN